MYGPGAVIRILLVDDHAIERQGIRALLDAQPDMTVVGEAPDGLEALPLVGSLSPDLIVTETIMPRMNGLELTGQILRRYPHVKVLALTRNDRRGLRAAARAGGRYRLSAQDGDHDELVDAVHAVVGGRQVLQPAALEVVLHDYLQRVHDPEAHRPTDDLTAREREVLKLIAEGNTNQDIAELLCLSRKTVETHRGNIMEKLDLHKVADLVKYAIREGLTGLG